MNGEKKILKDRVKIDDNIMYILQTKQKKTRQYDENHSHIDSDDRSPHTHTNTQHTDQILGCHSFNSIQFNQFLAIQSDKWSQNTPYTGIYVYVLLITMIGPSNL